MPKISIITVNLNSGPDLLETVKSVSVQSFLDYEHIVKDGGSSDDSLDLIQTLAKDPRRHILVGPDKGIYDAMNQALAVATGDYVLFLNAGDTFVDSRCLDVFAKSSETTNGADLVYSFIEDSAVVVKYPGYLSRWYFYRTCLCHQACFFLRTVLGNYKGFDITYKVLADHDLITKIMISGNGKAKRIPVSLVRIKPMGYSSRHKEQRDKERNVVLMRYFKRSERAFYALCNILSLHRLRIYLRNSGRTRKLYAGIRNLIFSFR